MFVGGLFVGLYIYICFKFIIQLKYKINNVLGTNTVPSMYYLHTIITDVGKYYIICLFISSIGLTVN